MLELKVDKNGEGTALTEANLESAMIPFAISALRNIPDFKKASTMRTWTLATMQRA